MAAAHQRQLDLVLHVLDMDDMVAAGAALDGRGNLIRQIVDDVVHARRTGRLPAFDGQESLGDGDADLAGVEDIALAIAFDDAQGTGLRLCARTDGREFCGK